MYRVGCVFKYFTNHLKYCIMKKFSLVIYRSLVKDFIEAVEFYDGQIIRVRDYGGLNDQYKCRIVFEVRSEIDLYYIGRAVESSVWSKA